MKKPLLLYIHGFNSSPQSLKANLMAQYCQEHRPDIKVVVPKLPNFPQQAAKLLNELVEEYRHQYKIGLVGSSLGGYLSVWLNYHFSLKAAVVNPAVRPYELLADYLGEQTNPYTNESYLLEKHHIDELKQLDVNTINDPTDFWLLQQEEDEVLDYRQAVERFQGGKQTVEKGGDHSFVGFERHLAPIIKFLEL